MNDLVIASQLPAGVNEQLARRLPAARIVPVPPGNPAGLPPEARILFASPMRIKDQHVPDEPPAGWPYGLKWVQLLSSGIDAYPSWLFDLPVTTARGSSAHAIAEFALAAIFAAAKQLPAIWISSADGWDWSRRPRLAPVRGSTVGIVGFGAIGRALAEKAVAVGAQVLATRRSDQPLDLPGAERAADLASLFARSDHVVIAAPLTPQTRGLVNAKLLAAAKPGLHLINISRGSLIDHEALARALDAGQVGLATLDVTEPEPLPPGHAFYVHPRVRLSPHISGSSPDLFDNVLAIFLRNLEAFQSGRPFENLVDAYAIAGRQPAH
jgi:phosphoglycerate dehydrogenase-like enzyme